MEDRNKDPNRESLITIRGLTKVFKLGGIEQPVLNDLEANFIEGEFVILLGKSGSGKSTLLNLISGIETPTKGDILIKGLKINQMDDRSRTIFRRDNIGFIFQFFNLIPTLTVLENVTLPLELAGFQQKAVRERAVGLLEVVGLAGRENDFPDILSGGEQQRVAIARALAHEPLLILADEPTGNLDEDTGEQVFELLLKLSRSAGKTLIMATHNPEVAPLADKVYQIHEGRLVMHQDSAGLTDD